MYDLPYEDQAEVHRLLGSFITAGEPEENPIDRQVADRLASLEALKAAAKWLGLPMDTAPTVKQYEQARAALDLEFSSGQIVRRWERWRTAGHALPGRGFVALDAELATPAIAGVTLRPFLSLRKREIVTLAA